MSLLKNLEDGKAKVFRFGKSIPLCEGMMPDVLSQNLPPQFLRLMVNMRLRAGIPVLRGGKSLVADLGADPVSGIWDHELGSPRSLYLIGDGCPGISPTVGSYVGKYDTELRKGIPIPHYENVSYQNTGAHDIVGAIYSDELYFAADTSLRRLGEVSRLTIPSGYDYISAAVEHEGVLLLALVGTAAGGLGTSAVFSFDGVTLTNVLSGINPVRGFFKNLRGQCGIVFNGTPNSIRVRDSGGTWGGGHRSRGRNRGRDRP